MIIDFLKTKKSNSELKITLDVLREFKKNESSEEYLSTMFVAWTKLEQLEEYLAYLCDGEELNPDTLEYIEGHEDEYLTRKK